MPILTHIVAPDCINQYEQSAQEHYEAGFNLLASGQALGIAMLTQSAEMLLKAAFFRYIGYGPAVPIRRDDLDDADADARTCGVVVHNGAYHSLSFWGETLIAVHANGLVGRVRRTGVNTPAVAINQLVATDVTRLRNAATILANNWTISTRYHAIQPFATPQDFEESFDAFMEILHLYETSVI